jgi:hypothetical protein
VRTKESAVAQDQVFENCTSTIRNPPGLPGRFIGRNNRTFWSWRSTCLSRSAKPENRCGSLSAIRRTPRSKSAQVRGADFRRSRNRLTDRLSARWKLAAPNLEIVADDVGPICGNSMSVPGATVAALSSGISA